LCVSVVYVCLLTLVRQTVFSSYPHALSYSLAEYFRANSWLAGSQQSTPPPLISLSLSLLQHVSLSVCSCSSSDFNSSLLCSLGLLSSLAYGLQYAPSPLASPYPSNSLCCHPEPGSALNQSGSARSRLSDCHSVHGTSFPFVPNREDVTLNRL